MKLTKDEFNRQSIKELRNELDLILKELGQRHGVALSIGTISYKLKKFTCRLTGLIVDDEDARGVFTKYKQEAMNPDNQRLYGITSGMIGVHYQFKDQVYEFFGIAPNNKKYPYIFFKISNNALIMGTRSFAEEVMKNPVEQIRPAQ